MIYVLDSGPLIVLFRHYYPARFPSLWQKFDALVAEQKIVSVREVFKEIIVHEDRLSRWTKQNRKFFTLPTPEELGFVTDVFRIPHFQTLIKKKERLQGSPVADPFVIAKAKIVGGCVITQEKKKKNAAQMPNVCEHFGIPYMDLERFMEMENWTF